MYGLGKPRSKLGRFLDDNKLSQSWLEKESGLMRNTISNMCNPDYKRGFSVESRRKVISALRRKGFDVMSSDFW